MLGGSGLLGCDMASLGKLDILKKHVTYIFNGSRSVKNAFMDLEDESDTFLQNVGNRLPNDASSHPRKLKLE